MNDTQDILKPARNETAGRSAVVLQRFVRRFTPEHRQHISEGLKRAYQAGRHDHSDTRSKIGSKIKDAWEAGKYEQAKEKIARSVRKAFQDGRLSREDARKKMGQFRALYPDGKGRQMRDRDDHPKVEFWSILSPDGERYEFRNLERWARRHHRMFSVSESSKTPRPILVRNGISAVVNGRRLQYLGWTCSPNDPSSATGREQP